MREEGQGESEEVGEGEEVTMLKRIVPTLLAVLSVALLMGAPASAKIVHRFEASFNGSEAPSGPFSTVTSLAVDGSAGASRGNVYVGEGAYKGTFAVEKFHADGSYAGVQITGAKTPQGSFPVVSGVISAVIFGVAVDGSSGANHGDVYVTDAEHGVVDRFNDEGEFICQITAKLPVSSEEKEHECNGAAGSETPQGSFTPAGVAVDSSGDLYVSDLAHGVVDEFGPEGKYMRQIQSLEVTLPVGLAFDSSGNLYVVNYGSSVVEFNATGEFKFVRALGSGDGPVSVAVDPVSGNIDVGSDGSSPQVFELDSAGNQIGAFGASLLQTSGGADGLAVGLTGKVYMAPFAFNAPESVVNVLGRDTVVPTVTMNAATKVAQTTAELNGHVDPETERGGGPVSECKFEYVTDKQFEEHSSDHYEGAEVVACTQKTPYLSATNVSASVAVLPSTTYHFRLTAKSSEGTEVGGDETFTTLGPPSVAHGFPTASAVTATVRALVDPFGYDTTCRVQYVDEADFLASGYASATTVPCPADLGSGFAKETATVELDSLHISTTYHYHFTVTNEGGTATGPDETFTTFGIKSFEVKALNQDGQPATQAGGHPYKLVVGFFLNTTTDAQGHILATGNIKDVETEMPAGLVGLPTATPRCTKSQFLSSQCPGSSQVGVIAIYEAYNPESYEHSVDRAMYNLVPPPGVPFEVGTVVDNTADIYIQANLRTGGDYGITAYANNNSEAVGVSGVKAELWGTPADPSHDGQRECPVLEGSGGGYGYKTGCASGAQPVAFLTDPAICSAAEAGTMRVDSWQDPGAFLSASSPLPAFTECDRLNFSPFISVLPDTTASDTPSGVAVGLHVLQSESLQPGALAAPPLRDATVTLPAGVTLNPAAANGLQACSLEQIALEQHSEPTCPDASKVGQLEVETPLLPEKLTGFAYLAEQGNNPFGSTFALYLEAQADGVIVKIAAKVLADPVTGQLTTIIENSPDLPYTDFKLHFFGGPRAPLASPKLCGTYETSSTMTPWSAPESGPPVNQLTTYQVTSGPEGVPCAAPGFAPGFTGGTTSNQAGGFTPFTFTMSRGDGEQNLATISTTLPPGLIGKLAGVPLCGEPQAREGTCPAASQIGHVTASVGAGNYPFQVPQPGRPENPVFLTGPYKGASFGLTVDVPAEAGPFNLEENGKPVVVRAQVSIDPSTAQVKVVSDPVPQILKGVPLDLRGLNVTIDRPEFIINPTSCEPMRVNGVVTSAQGASSALTAPFQVTNCAALAFKPKLAAEVSGKTSRANGASLSVKLTYPTGPYDANIARVKVELPKQLPSRLPTLQKACTSAQFEANPAGCPPASIIGHVKAITPIIPVPLEGPAYFVSHGGEAFPSLIMVLQGYGVRIDLVGSTFIDRVTGVTSSTFKTVPDAPVGTFEITLPQGPYSALAALGNLCTEQLTMPTEFLAQNGTQIHQTTKIAVTGCTKHKQRTGKHIKHGRKPKHAKHRRGKR